MSASAGDTIEWSDAGAGAGPNPVQAWLDEGGDATEGAEPAEGEEPPREPAEAEVRASLAEHDGNIVRAARALGLSSRYVLYRLMKRYGIQAEQRGG